MSSHRILRGAAATLLATTGLAAMAQGGPGMAPPPPPEVNVTAVQPRTVPLTFSYVGVTTASKTVEVRSRVRGFIESRDFEEGAYVKPDTLLYTIEKESFAADREVALAQVEQAEARLKLAEQELKRLGAVAVPGAVAGTDIDRQQAERANAAAAVRLAKAELAKANLQLSYTRVTAPLEGYIGKAQKELGALVDESQNSLLASVQQVDPIFVSVRVSEREFLAWRAAEAAGTQGLADGEKPYMELTFEDGSVLAEHGTLNYESAALDPSTATVELRGQFANPDHKIKPGQFVKVALRGWVRNNAIAVPQRAVGQAPIGSYVYVVADGEKAEMRPIIPGPWTGQDWIIEKGLAPGDRVITEGVAKVHPGIVVKPVDGAPAAAPAEAAPAK